MKPKEKAPKGFFGHPRNVMFLFVAALAAAISLAACGGGGSSSSSESGATPPSEESTASTASEESNTGEEAFGEPLKVWSAAAYTTEGTAAFEETKSAAEASVKAINAAGGVAGHPIELETCDDHLTPAGAQSCFQKAASDSSTIAMVGGYTIFGEAVGPIATQAGMAVVGGMGVEGERKEPIFFVQTPGYPNTYYIAAQHAVEGGAKKIGFYGVEVPGTAELLEAFEKAVEEGGGEVSTVQIPVTEASTAASSSKLLADNPEAVVMEVSALQTTSAVRDLRREGFEGPIYLQTTLFSEEGLEAFAKYKGLIGFQGMPPTNDEKVEGVANYNKAMDEYAKSAPRTELGLMNWLAFSSFKQIAESVEGEITRESFLKAAQETSELDTEELTAEVPGWYTGKVPYPSTLPNLFNNHGVIVTIEKGVLGWNGIWYPGLGGGKQEHAA